MKILVLTVSSSVSEESGNDLLGPNVEKMLLHHFPDAETRTATVPEQSDNIRECFERHSDVDFVITLGGTGISSRDITPDVTASYCERMLPGISEMLRFESCKHTPYAALSRGVAGLKGKTLIVNIPGSLKAALLCTRLLVPLISHVPRMIHGSGKESYEPGFMGMDALHPGS